MPPDILKSFGLKAFLKKKPKPIRGLIDSLFDREGNLAVLLLLGLDPLTNTSGADLDFGGFTLKSPIAIAEDGPFAPFDQHACVDKPEVDVSVSEEARAAMYYQVKAASVSAIQNLQNASDCIKPYAKKRGLFLFHDETPHLRTDASIALLSLEAISILLQVFPLRFLDEEADFKLADFLEFLQSIVR